jgi:hypothetical protein
MMCMIVGIVFGIVVGGAVFFISALTSGAPWPNLADYQDTAEPRNRKRKSPGVDRG